MLFQITDQKQNKRSILHHSVDARPCYEYTNSILGESVFIYIYLLVAEYTSRWLINSK